MGATENLVMAAVLAKGTSVIDNAAREPEIVDLCSMLTEMGASIAGAGTSTIVVEGVDELSPVEARDRSGPDRGRHLGHRRRDDARVTSLIRGGRLDHLELALDKLVAAGPAVEQLDDGIRVWCDDGPRPSTW